MGSKAIGLIVAALVVVAAVAGFMMLGDESPGTNDTMQEQSQTNANQESSSGETQGTDDTESAIQEHLEGANIGETVDATGQERVEISITDYMYEITELTISEGTTVVWTNNGNMAHDVTSDTEGTELGSQLLSNGESYEFTFDEAGEYLYHCSPHPFRMRAAITVVE